MQEHQLSKDYLRSRVIPLLFSTKNATVFRTAERTLEEYDTSVGVLQDSYDDVSKKDRDFWTRVATILCESFDVEDEPVFADLDFREFIKELLKIRFTKEFTKNDVRKLDSSTDIDAFLAEVDKEDNLVVDDGSKKQIIYSGEKSSREYTAPLTPDNAIFYPPLLIEVNEEDGELYLSGDKSQRNRFVNATKDFAQIKLKDEEPESYEELKISPTFIHELRAHDIFLTDIKLKGQMTNVNINVSTDEAGTIEINDFVDYDLLLQDKIDILSINKCGMVYITEDRNDDVQFTLNFQTFSRVDDAGDFIKIALELTSDDEEFREELEEILNRYGVEVYEPYYLPSAFYFNQFVKSYKNHRPKYYYPLDEIDGDTGLTWLRKNDIIESVDKKEIELDEETLLEKILSALEQAAGNQIQNEGEKYSISNIDASGNNRITFILKSYSDDVDDQHNRYYKITIPYRARPDSFEKINTIVLSRVNYHTILMSDGPDEVVNYIVNSARRQVMYNQELLLEKECRRSVKILEIYRENPADFRENVGDEKKSGYVIEDQINVLMRYVFRNYIAGGGSDEPDGLLQLGNHIYLIDSKQATSISKDEYTKSKEDIESSELGDIVGEEITTLIFVVSRNLIQSETKEGSLNPKARKRVSRESEAEFAFLSVEFLLDFYNQYTQNKSIILGSADLYGKIQSEINDLVGESRDAEDIDELAAKEKSTIGRIHQHIDQTDYRPESEKHYF